MKKTNFGECFIKQRNQQTNPAVHPTPAHLLPRGKKKKKPNQKPEKQERERMSFIYQELCYFSSVLFQGYKNCGFNIPT